MKYLIRALGAFAVAICFAAAPMERAFREFQIEGIHVSGLGVCDLTTQTANCWDMDAKPDPALSAQIVKDLTRSDQNVTLRFEPLNRFLVMSSTSNQISFQSEPGQNNSINWGGNFIGDNLQLLRLNSDFSQPQVNVLAYLYGLTPSPPVRLEAKEGAFVMIGAAKFVLGRTQSGPKSDSSPETVGYRSVNPPNENVSGNKFWRVDVGVYGDSDRNFSITALDKIGDPILYVDRAGRPVPPVSYLGELPLYNGDRNFNLAASANLSKVKPRYFPAQIVLANLNVVPDAFTLKTNIDPSTIQAYLIPIPRNVQRLIGPFPLVPAK
jgi:hypothetical protein